MIRKDRLEEQLLKALTGKILQPAMADYVLERFHEQLQQRMRQIQETTLFSLTHLYPSQSRD